MDLKREMCLRNIRSSAATNLTSTQTKSVFFQINPGQFVLRTLQRKKIQVLDESNKVTLIPVGESARGFFFNLLTPTGFLENYAEVAKL